MTNERVYKTLFDKSFLQEVLSQTSMFIMSYEIFKNGIQEYTKQFFWSGFDESGNVYDSKYHERFTGKKPYESPFSEAIKLFVEFGALDASDEKEIQRLRTLRNDAAHRMMKYLVDDAQALIGTKDVKSIVDLNYKVDHWWIKNFETAFNPSFDGIEHEIEDAASLTTYLLKHCYKSLGGI